MTAWILLTIVAVALLLHAESRGSRAGIWTWKPIASTGFVATALAAGATSTTYGTWVLAALVLSWWGDVLLIPKTRGSFLLGLGAFLLAHVAYVAAFVSRGVSFTAAVAGLVVLTVPFVAVARWLLPKVPAPMVLPVRAYMLVITAMVACAFATAVAHGGGAILAGALAFYLSDLSVARDRFVAPGFDNKLWGWPLYFGAQLVLASTVAP